VTALGTRKRSPAIVVILSEAKDLGAGDIRWELGCKDRAKQ